MATTYDRQAKLIREVAKEHMLRKMADFKMSGNTLLEIFGMSLQRKLTEQSNPHNRMGKHYGTNHNQRRNPTGSKLVRSFIRHSGKESQYNRELFKLLTGKQYGGEVETNVAS